MIRPPRKTNDYRRSENCIWNYYMYLKTIRNTIIQLCVLVCIISQPTSCLLWCVWTELPPDGGTGFVSGWVRRGGGDAGLHCLLWSCTLWLARWESYRLQWEKKGPPSECRIWSQEKKERARGGKKSEEKGNDDDDGKREKKMKQGN